MVVSRRGDFKGEREIEIPLPFDSSKVNCPEGAREGGLGHLVTFCLHRKSLARRRNISFPFAGAQSGRVISTPYDEAAACTAGGREGRPYKTQEGLSVFLAGRSGTGPYEGG